MSLIDGGDEGDDEVTHFELKSKVLRHPLRVMIMRNTFSGFFSLIDFYFPNFFVFCFVINVLANLQIFRFPFEFFFFFSRVFFVWMQIFLSSEFSSKKSNIAHLASSFPHSKPRTKMFSRKAKLSKKDFHRDRRWKICPRDALKKFSPFAFQHMFLNVFLMYHLDITFPSQNVSPPHILIFSFSHRYQKKKGKSGQKVFLAFMVKSAN